MLFSKVTIFIAFAGLVSAQNTTRTISNFPTSYAPTSHAQTSSTPTLSAPTSSAPTSTPSGQAKVHIVQVGDRTGNLRFYPEELNAAVGDTIQFQFYPRNHSVARSAFNSPCVPLDPSMANGTNGFFSGFMPVQQMDKFIPTFAILVKETTPIWYYCATGDHCGNGMVGVINPPKNNTDRTLAKFRNAAAGAKTVVPNPPNGGETDPNPSESQNPSESGNSTAPTATTNTPKSSQSHSGASSSFVASMATVMLGAVAVAAYLV